MKPKTMMFACVAIVCGFVAMLGVQQAISNGGPAAKAETAKVLYAFEDVKVGTKITEENAKFREVPLDGLPDDVIKEAVDYADRAAKVDILKGDMVRKGKLGDKGKYGIALTIPIGMRVKTLGVTDTTSHSGLMNPHDHVDVQVTYDSTSSSGKVVCKTKTLLEYLEVWATNERTNVANDSKAADAHKTSQVSLLVTSEQANYLALAEKKGVITLLLRSPSDTELSTGKDVDMELMEELQGRSSRDRPQWDRLPEKEPEKEPEAPVVVEKAPVVEPRVAPAPVGKFCHGC